MNLDSEKLLRAVWLFLTFTFGLSWAAFYAQQNELLPSLDSNLKILVQFGPAVGGLLATAYLSGSSGLLRLIRRLLPRVPHWRWILLAFCLPILVTLLSIGARGAFQPAMLEPESTGLGTLGATFGVLLLNRTFLAGGLGGELGWRGFLLPALLPQFGPFQASLLAGFLNGIWHFPAYGAATIFFVGFAVSMAFITTWLYHKTDGNLVPMIVLYGTSSASLAMTEQVFPSIGSDIGFVLITFLVWGIIAVRIATRSSIFKSEPALL